jgi:hypothetical protein
MQHLNVAIKYIEQWKELAGEATGGVMEKTHAPNTNEGYFFQDYGAENWQVGCRNLS